MGGQRRQGPPPDRAGTQRPALAATHDQTRLDIVAGGEREEAPPVEAADPAGEQRLPERRRQVIRATGLAGKKGKTVRRLAFFSSK